MRRRSWFLTVLLFSFPVAAAVAQEPLAKLRHGGPVRALAFSPDGKWLATASQDARVLHLWDWAAGKEVRALSAPPGGAEFVAFAPDGKLLATGGADGTVYLWDVIGGKEPRRLKGHDKPVLCAAFSPDGKTLASGGQDNTIRLWQVDTGKELAQLAEPEAVNALTFAPDGKLLASGGWFLPVHLWDVAAKKNVRQCYGHREPVLTLAFTPDGKMLVSGSLDRTARLWEVDSGKEIYSLDDHPTQVNGVAVSPDGRWLATAGGDRHVYLYTAAGLREVRSLDHDGPLFAVAFSADGRWLASGGIDTFARVWRVDALVPSSPPKTVKLSQKQLETCWRRLAAGNARSAYQAAWLLGSAPDKALPLLQERLSAFATGADRKHMSQLLTDLNSDKFAVRDKATKELERLGELAEPSLRKALAGRLPSLEARRRIERLLDRIQSNRASGLPSEVMRAQRAVGVLERIGTADARQLLEKLAQGMPEAQLTQDAQGALRRLAKRANR